MIVLGIMSGTSADGADLVRVRLEGRPPEVRHEPLERRSVPYPEGLFARVRQAQQNRALGPRDLAQLHHDLGRFYAEAAAPFRGRVELAALAGQTVWHEPPGVTWQLGEPSWLAEALGVPVVHDFRPADLAAGGEGAPLVPYPDLLLYGEEGVRRSIHNLGGISNLTYLPGRDAAGVLAFDTGPGNCLIDEAAARMGERYDEGGRIAAEGQVDEALVEAWLNHAYLRRPPPKSTGREVWRLERLAFADRLADADLVATVTAFTVRTIVNSYRDFVLPRGLDEVWVAGGGAKNRTLMAGLRAGLPVPVRSFEELGLDPLAREALAFAVLGYLRFLNLPNVLPHTTGARRAAVAGRVTQPSV
ncbi:MAG TPA: anhydro-N-acetylmuramic acid kinase [Oceanithermus profundus]|uniref:Anhydro-N-acetylmuramic acid kinase n=1 Tax=Oceanithermus profundus TaxID=187137 RepID=A0A7C5SQ52_9DEIN|nr:anhydro-N-acetylmuramic acid kinase [Oceanithermus profundus]